MMHYLNRVTWPVIGLSTTLIDKKGSGSKASISLAIPSSFQKGNYNIQLKGNNTTITKQLMIAD